MNENYCNIALITLLNMNQYLVGMLFPNYNVGKNSLVQWTRDNETFSKKWKYSYKSCILNYTNKRLYII